MTAHDTAREVAVSWPAQAERAGARVISRITAHVPAAAVGLVLGMLVLGPGMAPGFLLSYDMVFVPSPPFSAALLGISGGPARAVPSDAVVTVAAHVIPSDVLQKLILLLIFTLACAGAAALLRDSWRRLTGKPAPVLACLVSAVFYGWNPYLAERLLIGQWALLLGYAGLPWVLRELCIGPVRCRPVRLLVGLLPAAVGGFAAMTVTGLAAVPAALARGTGRQRGRRLLTVLFSLGLLSLPWLIPSLIVPVHTDPLGANLFAARADTPFGRLGSLVMLSGIWNAQTVPPGYGGTAAIFWLVIVVTALAGYMLCAGRRRLVPGLGAVGLISLATAAIGITSPGRAALRAVIAASPAFAVLRDGQQFVAGLALVEAIGLGAATAWLLAGRTGLAAVGAQRGAPGPAPDRERPERAAVALAVFALIAPVLMLPGLAFGELGRLRPVQYPADWLAARREIDASRTAGSVLLLPWAAYRRYPWNHGEAVYDPWNKLLSRPVISNDGLQVGRVTLTQESAASIRLNRIVTAPGPLTARLAAAGVRYVIIDAGPLLTVGAKDVASAGRLPGARVMLASRDLIVLTLPAAARQ
jgi:hypothetical protein